VDIAMSSHKVSLLLQSQLGSVKEPAGPKLDKYHAQYHTDTFPVFSHANRLIRCIIDCQLSLKDAVAARNALELARSFAARAWDNTPNVLKQVQGIGDVFMRKLAANGINSIDTLLATEPHRINLILGKQQPFGAQIGQKLSSFPNLMVSIKEVRRNVRRGKGVTLKLKCEVGFLNQTHPHQFGRVQIYVCFLLEDSNGQVIDFRRFGAHKLANGEEILLTMELTKPTSYIRSHVMCDEIAGTSRYAELQLSDIPSSIYPERSKNVESGGAEVTDSAAASTAVHNHAADAFDDDGVGDDELLAAVGADETNDGIEVVQDIDELMREMESGSIGTRSQAKPSNSPTQRPSPDDDDGDHAGCKNSVQLANGRWTCQHLCKEKGLECKHKCCREGVAKPRRRPRKSTKSGDNSSEQQKITAMESVSGITKSKDRSEKPSSLAIANTSKKRKLSSAYDFGDYDRGRSMETAIAGATSRNPSNHRDMSLDYDDGDVASADMAYLDADLWEPNDCDWNLPPSFQACDDSPEETAAEIQDQICPAARSADITTATTYSFKSPLSDVATADLQLKPEKSLFVTGQSSSPIKSTAPKSRADQERSSNDSPGDPFSFAGFGTGTTDLLTSRAATSLAHEASLATSAGGGCTSKGPAVTTDQTSYSAEGQCEEVKKKVLWQEDQKKLWDQLPAWMYENFGRYADFA
jgi:Sec63 Brl domain